MTASVPFFNADEIARRIRAADEYAFVWQSGGGTATIRVGTEHTDEAGDQRRDFVLGPGTYGWGGTSLFDHGELYLGPDDDGQASVIDVIGAGAVSDQDVADLVLACIKAGRVLDPAELEALGFDGTGRGILRTTERS